MARTLIAAGSSASLEGIEIQFRPARCGTFQYVQ
jgi:hypothetical protein